MARKASTHRLDPEVQTALDRLSRLMGKPKNRLINEAVKSYVQQTSLEMERKLEGALEALRTYRQRDPDFEHSIDAFAAAEAQAAHGDPAEGSLQAPEGPVQAEVRRLLHA